MNKAKYTITLPTGIKYDAKKVFDTHFIHSPSGKKVSKAIGVTDMDNNTRYYHPEEIYHIRERN